jgi:hypothetical protein
MPGLISGSTLRRGGSGQFINLANAQPQLPPTPSTSTGFTLITSNTLVTTYSSSLGNIQFSSSTAYSNIPGQSLTLVGTGTTSVHISGGTTATSTTTGALVVDGGVGIRDNLYVGGKTILRNLTVEQFTATTATVYKLYVVGTDSSYSTNTGAVVIAGGVGIGENLNVNRGITGYSVTATLGNFINLAVTGTNHSNGLSSGALIVAGGVGIGDNLYVGTTLNIGQTGTFNTDLLVKGDATFKGQLIVDGSGSVDLSPQAATVYIRPTLGGSLVISPSAPGSMDGMVIGGLIPKDAYFLNAYANNFIGLATTSTNLEKGALGSIPYQTADGKTSFIGIGVQNTVLVSNGTTATWTNAANLEVTTSTYSKNSFINTSESKVYHVILSTGTNNFAPLVEDTPLSYDASISTLQTTNLTATNTINVYGSVYSQEGITQEYRLLYTPRSTISIGIPPGGPRLGDFWIDPGQGATFQYVDDNGTKIWVQFTGL